jgi:hypothetical protein
MTTIPNKSSWEGYAALIWSLLLALPLYSSFHIPEVLWLAPVSLLFCISALRRGSPLAKGAAIAAMIITVLYLGGFVSLVKE